MWIRFHLAVRFCDVGFVSPRLTRALHSLVHSFKDLSALSASTRLADQTLS